MTEKQRRFVEAYMGDAAGNATEAARLAGYAHPNTQGPRLLVNVGIARELEQRQQEDPAVATRAERQAFWSALMKGDDPYGKEAPTLRERIKASELLGKTGGDFVDRTEGDITVRFEYEE